MTYHFALSGLDADPSGAAASASADPLTGGAAVCCVTTVVFALDHFKNELERLLEEVVDSPEDDTNQRRYRNHERGEIAGLLPRRPVYLPQLGPRLAEKVHVEALRHDAHPRRSARRHRGAQLLGHRFGARRRD